MSEPAALHIGAQQALRALQHAEARRLCLELISVRADFADGYFLLGIAELGLGHLTAAGEAFEQAVRLRPHVEYLAHYAKSLVLRRREGEALQIADRAAALQPSDAVILDTIGCVYSRLNAHEKAVPLFEAAVAQRPDHHQMRFNLASSLAFAGRFDEAADHYERIVAESPGFVKAHAALSRLKRQTSESNHIARLTGVLPLVQNSDQLHLRYALAKECEDIGDYVAAFSHLDAANRRLKAELGYDISLDGEIFERLKQCFARPDFFPSTSDVAERVIFVIGLPRTGTTLVDRILAAHPEVEAAGELSAMPAALKRLSQSESRRALDVATIEAAAHIPASSLGRVYLQLAAPHRRGLPRFTDKLPLNFFNVGFIARALPRARIVCLRRNALDTVWSNYKHLFATSFTYYNYSYDLHDTAAYYLMFDRLMRFWHGLFPDRILELQYEALVDSPERQIRSLLSHCELDWNADCLRFHEKAGAVATASAVQVRQPIYRDSVGQWRAYERQLAPVREFLQAHGILS